jgi:hypothetical protein
MRGPERRKRCHSTASDGSLHLVVIAVLLAACARAPLAATQSVTVDQPFALKMGQSVRLAGEGLELGFETVVSDSRCPRGVQCIRAGEATIRVAVEKAPSARATFELRTTASAGDATYGMYSIRLLSVNPYPDANRRIQPEEYEATFVVTRPQP